MNVTSDTKIGFNSFWLIQL